MKPLKFTLIIIILICLLDMPYGYYEIFRIVAMVCFFYLAFRERDMEGWKLLWIASAIIVQPIFKLSIERHIWEVIDISWAILLLTSIFKNNKTKV